MAKVGVPFTVDSKEHAKLLEWLDLQPNKSAAIRDVLMAHLEGSAVVDVGTVHQAVLALSAEVCSKLEELSDTGRALRGGVSLGDVYTVAGETRQAVKDLGRKLANGAVIAAGDPEPEAEEVPEDVTANLAAWADLS